VLDKRAVIETAKRYADAVAREFSPSAIVLYGSYVNGTPNEDSDIDVAVVFNGFNGDRLKMSANLWRLTESISLYIEPVLLDGTDDRSGFVGEIFRTGQVVYRA
jgi:predicted nucleotidyltransferase